MGRCFERARSKAHMTCRPTWNFIILSFQVPHSLSSPALSFPRFREGKKKIKVQHDHERPRAPVCKVGRAASRVGLLHHTVFASPLDVKRGFEASCAGVGYSFSLLFNISVAFVLPPRMFFHLAIGQAYMYVSTMRRQLQLNKAVIDAQRPRSKRTWPQKAFRPPPPPLTVPHMAPPPPPLTYSLHRTLYGTLKRVLDFHSQSPIPGSKQRTSLSREFDHVACNGSERRDTKKRMKLRCNLMGVPCVCAWVCGK